MFLALRDIRFARGRFALMTGVVALVTLLLVLLSSLTRGLDRQSTSAVASLTASRVLLAPSGGSTTWADSVIAADILRDASASEAVQALQVSHARVALAGRATGVALFGMGGATTSFVTLPRVPGDGEVVLPQQVADQLGVRAGDAVTLDGVPLRVAAVEPTRWYAHSPVAWSSIATANRVGHAPAGQATALLVPDAAAADALAARHHLVAMGVRDSLSALPGYRSEHGSLLMIQGFLYGISALVIMAFLSVWTVQRTRDIAVLRALGASRRHVLGDSMAQAGVLLLVAALSGLAVGVSVVRLLGSHVPVELAWGTSALPALGVLAVGLLGALVATRRVTCVDPLLALGGN